MLSGKDFLLLAVSFGSLLVGVLAPDLCAPLRPFPIVWMMLLLFLSFLSISISQIWQAACRSPLRIAGFLAFRMILFPAAVALLFRLIWPSYSLAAMLLAGISTGAVAPFFANLLQGNMALAPGGPAFSRHQPLDHELHPRHRLQLPVLFAHRAHRGRPVHFPLLCPGDPGARLAQLPDAVAPRVAGVQVTAPPHPDPMGLRTQPSAHFSCKTGRPSPILPALALSALRA